MPDKYPYKNQGEKLKKWMEHEKMSVQEVATVLGVSRTAIYLVLSGENQLSSSKLQILANRGLNVQWLLTDEAGATRDVTNFVGESLPLYAADAPSVERQKIVANILIMMKSMDKEALEDVAKYIDKVKQCAEVKVIRRELDDLKKKVG